MWLALKEMQIPLVLIALSTPVRAAETPNWVRNPGRAVEGGDLMQVGFAKDDSLDGAFFLAEAIAVRHLMEECGGFPHRDTKIFDRFYRKVDGQFEAFARAGLAIDDCEKAKHASSAVKEKLTNSKLADNQGRYRKLMGIANEEPDPPDWVRANTISRSGSSLKVVCSGDGPSMDFARTEAMAQCGRAARQAIQSNFKVKTLSVQTEKGAVFHEEVSSSDSVVGLQCQPQKDATQALSDHYRVWILCQYDLTRVKSALNSSPTQDSGKPGQSFGGARKTVTLVTVPVCSEVLITGSSPRVYPCSHNPITVPIEPGDREITVRAEGYLPKTIPIAKEGKDEPIQVLLDHP